MSYEQLNNKPELKEYRRALRNEPTAEEILLWNHLKGKQLDGRKFRRQHSFGNFILDFYCPSEKLAIELDGHHHFTEEGRKVDSERDDFLSSHGIRILRFSNGEITKNTQQVIEKIKSEYKS